MSTCGPYCSFVDDLDRLAPSETRFPKTTNPRTQAAQAAAAAEEEEARAQTCWNLDTYDAAQCGGSQLKTCWENAGVEVFKCAEFEACGVQCAGPPRRRRMSSAPAAAPASAPRAKTKYHYMCEWRPGVVDTAGALYCICAAQNTCIFCIIGETACIFE